MIKKSLLIVVVCMSVGITQAMNGRDEDPIISLPSSETIQNALSDAGCANIIWGIHRGLGNGTFVKENLISFVNARADEMPEGTGGLMSPVSQEDRDKVLQVLFSLNLYRQQNKQQVKMIRFNMNPNQQQAKL